MAHARVSIVAFGCACRAYSRGRDERQRQQDGGPVQRSHLRHGAASAGGGRREASDSGDMATTLFFSFLRPSTRHWGTEDTLFRLRRPSANAFGRRVRSDSQRCRPSTAEHRRALPKRRAEDVNYHYMYSVVRSAPRETESLREVGLLFFMVGLVVVNLQYFRCKLKTLQSSVFTSSRSSTAERLLLARRELPIPPGCMFRPPQGRQSLDPLAPARG